MKSVNVLKNIKTTRFVWELTGEFMHLMALSGLICLSDQLLKQSVDAEPEENFPREMPHSKGYVKIMRAHNPGFSMGRLGEYPEFVKLSSLAATGFLAGILQHLTLVYPGKFRMRKLGIALVIGGAMSNILDRAQRGKVTDYINIQLGTLKRAIVNIGDIAIYLGGILYILAALLGRDD